MKKLLMITLLVCSIGIFTACSGKNQDSKKENSTTTGKTENVTDDTAEKKTEESNGDKEGQEGSTNDKEEVKLPQILSLRQEYLVRQESANDILVLYSKGSNVALWEGTEQYLALEYALEQRWNMQAKAMDEEADNILSFVQEMMDVDSEDFETQVSTLDIEVRRADSVVVSFISDSYADYGFISEFRGMWGSNYDAQTGKELLLADVITDMEKIPGIVLKELNSHLMAGEGYSETVVKEYFKNTPIDSISWTLDYNGITFYFNEGDLEEVGNKGVCATISFTEYPELFNKKYTNVPKAYMVRLPIDHSYFTDLDGDGSLDELNCTGFSGGERKPYTKFGIFTTQATVYNYEELSAHEYYPYYVKTEDGNHYVYLFCDKNEVGNHVHSEMMLVVYNINGGIIKRVGNMNIAPAYIPSDTFVLPLDPNNLLLDNFDSLAQDAEVYKVGNDGMPVKK